MHRFVVRSAIKGNMYVGPSLEAALETIRQDIYRMRNECQALSDAQLYLDGELVETGLDASGKVAVVPKRPKAELPPAGMPPKWAKH